MLRRLVFALVAAATLAAPALAQEAAAPPAPAEALARILQDPEARQALIDHLLRESAEATPETTPSLAQQMAAYTQAVAESLSAGIADITGIFSGVSDVDVDGIDWGAIGDAAVALAMVAAATIGALWLLRLGARLIWGAMGRMAANGGRLRRVLLLLASVLIDALLVVAAWAGGYAFALALGAAGQMDIRQGLFLNAFLLIELSKAVLRAVLAPQAGALRLPPITDTTAAYIYFWLARLIGILGYGLLLVVPIVSTDLSPAAGQFVKLLVGMSAAAIAVLLVLQNRRPVRLALEALAARFPGGLAARVLVLAGRLWHVIALAYIAAVLLLWATRPLGALGLMVEATVQSVVAIAVGVAVISVVTRAVTGGMRLPPELRTTLPTLEARLNAYVPAVLGTVRGIVTVGVLFAILQAWTVVDVLAWLGTPGGRAALGAVLSVVAVLLFAGLVWLAVTSWIEYRLNPNVGRPPTARERTLLALMKNAVAITLMVMTVMLALAQIGLDIAPLLAGAGVVGLAIGFGAQKLVQDIITGAFIQIENAMNEGDVVTAGGTTGVVEKLTIRSVGLRDLNGVYHLIPFSAVDRVSNFMHGFAYHTAEIGVAYRESVAEVKQVMAEAYERLKETDHAPFLLDFEMHGLTQFADSAVMVRGRIKTLPGKQWAAGRAYNEILKELFDERGIEIPFPHLTLYMGEDKRGKAPPLRVALPGKAVPEGGE